MSTAPSSPQNDPNLSGLGRALLGTNEGSKPSAAWVPPTAEELHQILPQYEIVKMLGRGGMGAVYMGTQTALERPVAIKILSSALEDSDAGFTQRFKNEAKAMAKLNHPGIVSVYDFGEAPGGLLYIVMEYVDGTDVAKMIAAKGRLHTEHAMAITAHVCDALAYAHERGIIHRDIKPANIMVGYDGEVKVADFGLAKVNVGGKTLGLTMSGMAMGTLHFMAPEALMLGTAVDHRADIYAVGVMLYQMLTGKLPQGMFKMPSLIVPGLDPRYDGIITKAIMEDREARYQSAREMRADLDSILTQPVVKADPAAAQAPQPALPTQARPQRPGARPPQPIRSASPATQASKKSFPLGLVATLVLLAGAAWFLFFKPQEPKTPDVTTAQTQAAATTQSLAKIRLVTPDAVRVLKLEKSQPRLYDSNPLRVIEGVTSVLNDWQFTSILQRIDNEYTIHVEKPGVIYAFGAFRNGTTPQDSLGSDASRWVDAEGDITGAMVKFCYKRNVSAGEILKLKAFELQFAAPNITLEITPAAASATVTASSAPTSTDSEDWTSLFNGKDLTGWEANPPNFPAKVIGGMLKVEGVSVREDSGHLFYVGEGSLTGKMPEWKNFELIATLKTLRMGNSGLRIHSRPASREFNINATGPEINIWNEGMTTPVDKDHRTGGIPRMAVVPVSYFKDGEWFEMKIRVENDTHLQVWVRREGATTWTTTVDWTQPANWTPPPYHPNARLSSGTIAFTNWVPADGEVWVREIKMRSLDAPATPLASTSASETVTFNGHRYQFVPGSFSWQEVDAKAKALGGHLATITSKEENDFLLKTYSDKIPDVNRNIWLGAIQDKTGGDWRWVTGEPFTFVGWVLNEPNGVKGGGGEVGPPFMLNYYRFREGVGWNDSSTHSKQVEYSMGFIVEWDSVNPATATVAQPTVAPVVPSSNSTGDDTSGWTNLFNGKDLSNWELHPSNFPADVFGGLIRIRGSDTIPVSGNMYYRGSGTTLPQWTDFELICTVMTENKGNSGIFLHSSPGVPDKNRANGVEVQIWNDLSSGSTGKSGSLQRAAPLQSSRFRDGEWFQVKTRVEGKRIQTWLKKPEETTWLPAIDWTQPADWAAYPDRPGLRLGSGTISMQNNPPLDGVVWFKEVKFRSLDKSAAQPAATVVPSTPATPPAGITASATTWIDTKGRVIQARFISLSGDQIALQTSAQKFTIPLSTLSAASQQIARDLQAASQTKTQIPADALSFGNSRYACYDGTFTWLEAKAKAEALGGHLATITTAAEDAWVVSNFQSKIMPSRKQFWIGGIQDTPTQPWKWVTGETLAFTQWAPGEPNNAKGTDAKSKPPYMLGYLFQGGRMGWNDFSESQLNWRDIIVGYLVEWETAPLSATSTTSPQPLSDGWLVGSWHQTNDGLSRPIYQLELKADHTASFAGGNLHTTGQWRLENEAVTVSWSNGARYRIDVPSNAPSTDLNGMIFDINGVVGKNTPLRMQKAVADFSPLFPNDSLSGWTGDTAAYRVSNGIVASSGRGQLVSPKEYGDFHLKFDLRIAAESNSGIGIWRDPTTNNTLNASRGFEVQILDDTASKYTNLEKWQYHGGIYYFKTPQASAMGPVGSWNTHEIRMEGTQVKVIVNGRLVQDADVTRLSPLVTRAPRLDVSRRRGHLILLGNTGTVEFRNMQIKELP